MKNLILICICFCFNYSIAQPPLAISSIPDSLKNNAIAVYRYEHQLLEIKRVDAASLTYKVAISILNKAGDSYAQFHEVYDKFSTIKNIKASLYDAQGKKIKDFKSSEIKDQSLLSSISIFDDNRVKIADFSQLSHPYTIEYSYEQDYKGIIYLPSWNDFKGYGIALEKGSYEIVKPKNYELRHIQSDEFTPIITDIKEKLSYKWSSSGVKPLKSEPLSVGPKGLSKWVKIAPNLIEYDSSKGDFSNWNTFGQWIHQLNENSDKLPPVIRQEVQSLIKHIDDPLEKTRRLYNYMQQQTRYVSVQLGIGGFRPIIAEKVAESKYGDCKALSNYMKALLNEAGIKSHLVVIGSGMPKMDLNFSSIGQANHMILAVPLKNDTTYLECTSQIWPMGFIGHDNANRPVLLVGSEGGKIAYTPAYKAKDNKQIRHASITILNDASASIELQTHFTNTQFENHLFKLFLEPQDQRKRLLNQYAYNAMDLVSVDYKQKNKQLPEMSEHLKFKVKDLFTKNGDRIFLTINQTNVQESSLQKMNERKTQFSLDFPYTDEDEIVYTLPVDFSVEFVPRDIEINSEFGSYTAKFIVENEKLIYKRRKVMEAKTYPADKYNAYIDFIKSMNSADKQKAIFKLKSS